MSNFKSVRRKITLGYIVLAIAHRILPMFRQLHINDPIEALENLERNPEQLNSEKAQAYWQMVYNCLDAIEKDWKTNGYI